MDEGDNAILLRREGEDSRDEILILFVGRRVRSGLQVSSSSVEWVDWQGANKRIPACFVPGGRRLTVLSSVCAVVPPRIRPSQ